MPAKGVNEHFQQVCVEDKVNKKRNKFYNKCVYFPAQDALCPKAHSRGDQGHDQWN